MAATTVAAKFDDSRAAEKALRKVNRTLRDEDKTIYEGAVVTLDRRGDLEIKDMKDIGLRDILVDAADTTISIGIGGIGLLMGVATAGAKFVLDSVRLVTNNAGQVIGLTGEVLSYPSRMMMSDYAAGREVVKIGESLEAGEVAVVITADPGTAAGLATDLARSGGRLL